MLNRLVVDLTKPERVVAVGVIVSGDPVEPAAPCIAGRLARVDTNCGLRVKVGGVCVKSGQGSRGIDRIDRQRRSFPRLEVPFRHLEAAAHQKQPSRGPNRQRRRSVRLLEPIGQVFLGRLVHPDAVERDFGGVAPAAADVQVRAAVEQAREVVLRFGELVRPDAVAAAHVQRAIGAGMERVSAPDGEPTAAVGRLEERVQPDHLAGESFFDFHDPFLCRGHFVRLEVRGLFRGRGRDDGLTSVWLRRLCQHWAGRADEQRNRRVCSEQNNSAHCCNPSGHCDAHERALTSAS